VIVGAGIGGLSAAVALRNAGVDVVLLERAERLDPLGAGISLFRNAMAALERLGMRDAVTRRGAPAARAEMRTAAGRLLGALPDDVLAGAVALHRGDLQTALLEAAPPPRLGAGVVAVARDGAGVLARCRDGTTERGDVLIGADGIHSVVRDALFPHDPRYAGYTAWRSVVGVPVEAGRWSESWGCGQRFGSIDLGERGTYWFATKNAGEGERDEAGGRRAEVARRFSSWHEPIRSLIDATPSGAILRNDVFYLDPLPRWSRGPVILLGDAAHASTPGIGQGAAQAIEDAVVLAEALRSCRDPVEAAASYEAARRPRAERVLRLSRRVDRLSQLDRPLACRLRNAVVTAAPASAHRRSLVPILDA
jgi:2-polyprenyl-6-methoxyphenol hydroxylase-like FAD-dependent oxidoreductase